MSEKAKKVFLLHEEFPIRSINHDPLSSIDFKIVSCYLSIFIEAL
jgi:hypothetical protein